MTTPEALCWPCRAGAQELVGRVRLSEVDGRFERAADRSAHDVLAGVLRPASGAQRARLDARSGDEAVRDWTLGPATRLASHGGGVLPRAGEGRPASRPLAGSAPELSRAKAAAQLARRVLWCPFELGGRAATASAVWRSRARWTRSPSV